MNEEEILNKSMITLLIPDEEYRYHEFPSFRVINGKIKYRNPLDYCNIPLDKQKEYKDYLPQNHFEYFWSAELWLKGNPNYTYFYNKIPKYPKNHYLFDKDNNFVGHNAIAKLYNDNGCVVIENINEMYYLLLPEFTNDNEENLYRVGLYFIDKLPNKLCIIHNGEEISIQDYLDKNFRRTR